MAEARDLQLAAEIGTRLAAARHAAGLSQRATVEGLERVGDAYLSRLEAGHRLPSVRALRELAPRLGVSVAWLETGDDVVDVRLPRTFALELRLGYAGGELVRRPELVAALDDALATAAVPPFVAYDRGPLEVTS